MAVMAKTINNNDNYNDYVQKQRNSLILLHEMVIINGFVYKRNVEKTFSDSDVTKAPKAFDN